MSDFQNYNNVISHSFISGSSACCGIGDFMSGWNRSSVNGNWASTQWSVSNLAMYIPIYLEIPILALKMAFDNRTVTATGNVDLGIYDEFGNRLVSTGSTVRSTTVGPQVIDITDTILNPGTYFMAMSNSTSGTDTAIMATSGSTILNHLPALSVQQQTSALPLPATATFANPAQAFLPLIAIQIGATF